MKKILTILAATATMFAFGAGNLDTTINHGADFEAFTAGNAFSAGLNDSAQQSNPYYWYTADADAANIISNYTGSGTDVPIASRPEKFADDENSKYLQVETTGKLYRTVKDNGGSENFLSIDEENLDTYAHSLTNSAIYLDTLVKFTAADSVFGDDGLGADDKIAIEYVEHESEGDGDETVTNFVIRAGFKTGTGLNATNYYAYLPGDPTFANFDKDAWHRLTVRTIPDVGDGTVGFVIYVDETNLVYSTDVSAGFGNLDPSVEGFYNNEKHALFPSAVLATKLEGKAISAAAFSGNGSLDDVVFTTSTPNFITAGESVVAKFSVDSGVTAISVQVGSGDPIAVDMTAETLAATLPAGTTAFTVTATVDDENGYTFAKMTVGGVEYNTNPASITGYAGGEIAITTTRNNFNLFDENGDPISGTYQKLSDALAVEGVAKIQLAHDYDVLAVEGNEFAGYETGNDEYVLDLNGYTINGGDDSAGKALITVYGTLTIIDSRGGGEIIYDATQANTGILSLYGSDIYIGASTGDAGATFTGVLFEDGSYGNIVKGYFDDAANGDSGAFLWGTMVDSNSTCSATPDANNYWVVAPKGGSEPTQVAVPTALIGIMYDGTLKTGVVENVAYTLTGNTGTDAGEYEATATLAAGYIWSDNTTADKKIAWGILPNNSAEVVVTLASEIAEYSAQLEFPTATATIGGVAVEGTTNWVENAISEPEAGATNTYTVTFTVTTANYAGSHGTATFKVWKAAGGKTYPSYITDATAQGKYDAWATANNISATDFPDTGNAYQDAYLLNIAPGAEDQTLKPTAITMEGGKVVITANQTLTSVNGKVYVKVATTLAGLSTAEWAEATLSEGKVQVTPGSSDTAGFYKIKVDF